MAAIPTKITTDLQPDDAHVQTADARFDAQDRQKIDTQIIGCQRHLAESLINGTHSTWVRVAASSPTLVAGDVVCLAGLALGYPVVTLATAAAIAVAGCAYGVVLRAAAPGARVLVALDGVVGPSVTGLAATAGVVRVSSAGRPQRVASYSTGDYPLGTVDSQGYLTVARGAVVAASGGASGEVDPDPDTVAQRGPDGELKAVRFEVSGARLRAGAPTQAGDIGVGSSGQTQAWRPGVGPADVLLAGDLVYVAHWEQAAVSAGVNVTKVIGAVWPDRAVRITEVILVPHGAFSGFSDTEYVFITVGYWNVFEVQGLVQLVTVTGNDPWIQYAPVPLLVDPEAVQPTGTALMGSVEHVNGGRSLPAFSVFVKMVPHYGS